MHDEIKTFQSRARDPEAWRTKARALRSTADAIWHSFMLFMATDNGAARGHEEKWQILQHWAEMLETSKLLYGYALEVALKARIIENDPENVRFKDTRDGDGNITDVQLTKVGVKLGKGHDLERLATVAGVLDEGNTALFPSESDRTAAIEILRDLTDRVRWRARYPTPTKFTDGYPKPDELPGAVLGLKTRDFLDPLLDALLGSSDAPSSR